MGIGILENLSLVKPVELLKSAGTFLSESTADSFSKEEIEERAKRRIQKEKE